MKKSTKFIIVATVAILLIFSITACNVNIQNTDIIGETLPSNIEVTYSINENMSAWEMFEAGVKNYYDQNYTAMLTIGEAKAGDEDSPLANMNIESVKIVQDGNVYSKNTVIVTDSPVLVIVRGFAESAVEVAIIDDTVTRREAKSFGETDDIYGVKEWGDKITMSYAEYFPGYTLDDPKKLFTFKHAAETVDPSVTTEPVDEGDYYTFTIGFDLVTSLGDYGDVIIENALSEDKREGAGVELTKHYYKVTMWKNGLIRSYENCDQYTIIAPSDMFVNNQQTTNNTTVYFSYNEKEMIFDNYTKELLS